MPPPGGMAPPPPSNLPPPPGSPDGAPPLAPPPTGGGGLGTLAKVLLGVGALAVVLLVGVAALGVLLADSGTISAGSIERGECFADFAQFETDDTGTGEVTSVDRIDCTEAHALEAYYVGPAYESYELYPGVEEIDDVAVTSCRQRFERFVDFDWESSELDFWWLTPTQDGWDQGDRELVCLVGESNKGSTVGTLENAGR